MLRVGLTGSIAVGKSYVTLTFTELGCRVVDADLIAREVVEPGSEGLRSVVQVFGAEVLLPDNSLNRQKLAEIIFSDKGKRLLLNSILHPLIISAQDEAFRHAAQIDAQGVLLSMLR
ncbi:MAG: dephospho-CoA kinase [Pyrinomonadaceae bacterium]